MSSPGDEWSFPVAFHFGVKIGENWISFSEVQGIECELETEPIKPGGDSFNCFFIPKNRRFSDLVLKRGCCKQEDPFFVWCKNILTVELSKKCIDLRNLEVVLLDGDGQRLTTWFFKNVYPYKWTLGAFDSMKNEIAIETVSLKYSSFEVSKG